MDDGAAFEIVGHFIALDYLVGRTLECNKHRMSGYIGGSTDVESRICNLAKRLLCPSAESKNF